jgi:hypothetical protein
VVDGADRGIGIGRYSKPSSVEFHYLSPRVMKPLG